MAEIREKEGSKVSSAVSKATQKFLEKQELKQTKIVEKQITRAMKDSLSRNPIKRIKGKIRLRRVDKLESKLDKIETKREKAQLKRLSNRTKAFVRDEKEMSKIVNKNDKSENKDMEVIKESSSKSNEVENKNAIAISDLSKKMDQVLNMKQGSPPDLNSPPRPAPELMNPQPAPNAPQGPDKFEKIMGGISMGVGTALQASVAVKNITDVINSFKGGHSGPPSPPQIPGGYGGQAMAR